MTRRHRGFTHVHPSGLPQPVTPGWDGSPWAFPRASHPAVTRNARQGGDSPLRTGPETTSPTSAEPPSTQFHSPHATSCRTPPLTHDPSQRHTHAEDDPAIGQPITPESSASARPRTAADSARRKLNPGLEPKTVVNTLRMLHRAWEDFTTWGWAKRNVVSDAHPPRVPRRGRKVWTVVQVRRCTGLSGSDREFPALPGLSGTQRARAPRPNSSKIAPIRAPWPAWSTCDPGEESRSTLGVWEVAGRRGVPGWATVAQSAHGLEGGTRAGAGSRSEKG